MNYIKITGRFPVLSPTTDWISRVGSLIGKASPQVSWLSAKQWKESKRTTNKYALDFMAK